MTGGVPFDQIAELAKLWGAPGALIIILGWRVWKLELDKANAFRDRLADWKEIGLIVKEQSVVMADWVTANEARTRAIDASVEGMKLQTSTTVAQTEALHKLSDIVARAMESNQRVQVALARHGLEL